MAQAETSVSTVRMVKPGWLDETREQFEWCHLMCLIPTVCPCNDDAWALVNEYPHTTAECECTCHYRRAGEGGRDDRVLLARTWNDNPSGRLWEARWFRSGGRYYRDVDAPGVFVPAHEFPNEATFWADFEDERAKFHGMRAGDSRD